MGISSWRSKRQSNTLPRNRARERAIGASYRGFLGGWLFCFINHAERRKTAGRRP
uniref:Uncharacterized protein n=1 Tax=Siphoviridae sp. ctLsx2 TaxID=2826254 RepID=A0A8S5QSN5_9CAUD|nr:MAG TPA: hypothetical protein [Siphoviridae sp. ctLsx2]DAJ15380.1 MAG TPA: hypothetical protein [Siphoviridae sp. ctqcj14]